MRRALRDQLGILNWKLSEGQAAKEKKGAAVTQCLPKEYIDDDLFGFMDAGKGDKGTHKRTSPVRVAPLLALDPYEGDLDFGTNYMGVDAGGTPNIYETEIHGGLYRGTVLIELDAVGKSRDGEWESSAIKNPWELEVAEKAKRLAALLTALQHLWSSGRQSRFLADISPKFIAAAALTAKVPIFLESVHRHEDGIDPQVLTEAVADAAGITAAYCFGAHTSLFKGLPEGCVTIGDAFEKMHGWVKVHYGV